MRIRGRAHDALARRCSRRPAAIRPDDVQVGADAAGVNQFRGNVEIVEYLGREQRGACCGSRINPRCGCTRRRSLAPGDTVPVTFPPDKVIFLPAEWRRTHARRARNGEPRELDLTALLCLRRRCSMSS